MKGKLTDYADHHDDGSVDDHATTTSLCRSGAVISADSPGTLRVVRPGFIRLTVAVEQSDDCAGQATDLVQRDVGRLQQSSAGSALDGGVAGGEGVDELATGDDARHDSVGSLSGQLRHSSGDAWRSE